MTKFSTGTGPTDIIHDIASKRDGLRGPIRAPLPENMPRAPQLAPTAMRAEHLWNAEQARARAPASRAHPRPAGESHARIALPTPICAMFLDSKMRPRIVLRQAEHRVSIGQALSACGKSVLGV